MYCSTLIINVTLIAYISTIAMLKAELQVYKAGITGIMDILS